MQLTIDEIINNFHLLYILWGAVVTLIYFGVCGRGNSYIKKVFLLIAYMIYIYMVFNREIDYGVGGIDAINYQRYFDMAASLSYQEYMLFTQKEWGIWTFFWMFCRVIPDYQVFVSVCHSVAFVLCLKCLHEFKFEKRGLISWLFIFLFTVQLFYMFNILRTGIAVYLATLSLFCSVKGNTRQALLYAIIALETHHSASLVLIGSVIFYMKSNGLRVKTIYLVIAGFIIECVLLLYLSRHPLTGTYSFYNTFNEEAFAWGRCMAIILGLLIAWMGSVKEMTNICTKVDITSIDILLTALLIIPINSMFSIANRIYMMYLPFLYTLLYFYISSNISIHSVRLLTMRKAISFGAMILILIDFIRYTLVIIPQSMGEFNISF